MQPEETAARPDRRRLKLAALIGAAVLAIPGAGNWRGESGTSADTAL